MDSAARDDAIRKAKTVGERIAALRKPTGLKQSHLSRACGFPRSTIGLIETGQRVDLACSTIGVVALAMGATIDFLVLGRGKTPSEEDVVHAIEAAKRDPTALHEAVDRMIGIVRAAVVRPHKRRRASTTEAGA